MTAVTALLVLGTIASTCYPLGYRLLVDGALAGSWDRTAWGIVLVGGLISLGWVLSAVGATEAMALSDRISVYRMSQLMTLISGVPGLEHLERPDYLSQVERLNTNRRQLSSAPRQLLSNIASGARIIALVVLLATVSPGCYWCPRGGAAAGGRPDRQEDHPPGRRRHSPRPAAGRPVVRPVHRRRIGRRDPRLRARPDAGSPPPAANHDHRPAQRARSRTGVRRAGARLDAVRARVDGRDRLRRGSGQRSRDLARHRLDVGVADPPLAGHPGHGGHHLGRIGIDPRHRRPAVLARGPRGE